MKKEKGFRANMIQGHGRQDVCLKGFLVAYYKGTHFELVAEKTRQNGQMGSDRQQGGVHIGDCGATGVEFVVNKLVIKEGSDCCGELGGVCVTKGNGGMEPGRS